MTLHETAKLFIKKNECNLYAADIPCSVIIFGHKVDVESIWHEKNSGSIYIHCGCKEFEGDIDIQSLSEDNKTELMKIFEAHI